MDGTETNKAIVRHFLGAVVSGDSDTSEQLHAPECAWWVVERGNISRKAYADEYDDLFVLAGGRIVRGREYFDTGKVTAFFGPMEG